MQAWQKAYMAMSCHVSSGITLSDLRRLQFARPEASPICDLMCLPDALQLIRDGQDVCQAHAARLPGIDRPLEVVIAICDALF